MEANEFNEFLKIRRTCKVFEPFDMPENHKDLLIDSTNYAPAQNSSRNFIPLLVEKYTHREWFLKNVFYNVPKYDKGLKIDVGKEYQMGVLTASFVLIYLEANRNFPLSKNGIEITRSGNIVGEPDNGDLHIRNINIGLSLAFTACQAYLLNYDVGFIGCSRGANLISKNEELRIQYFEICKEYDVDLLALEYGLSPSYAICIGKGKSFTSINHEWYDGFYSNRKKHSLKPIENVRKISKLYESE